MQGFINKIKADRFTAVSVESKDGFDKPFVNYTLERIVKEFGSVEQFFGHIKQEFPDYNIVEKRQNGTNSGRANYKTIGVVNDYHHKETMSYERLGSPMGLGVAELIDLNINKHEKTRLEVENQYLKSENERLKKVEDEYKDYRLQVQYSDKKNESTNSLITEALSSPVVLGLIEKFAAPKTVGLASPEPTDEFVKVYNSLDENSKNLFKNILYLARTKQGFFDTLADLVEMELKN